MKHKFYFLFLFMLASCFDRTEISTTSKAESLNEKGVKLFVENLKSKDSMLEAIKYIDSAIKVDPNNITFYYNKVEVYKYFKEADSAIAVLDKIANIAPDDFRIPYTKAELYILKNLADSSNYYFGKSLLLIESDKSAEIKKYYLKIKIEYLKGDTNRFRQLRIEFLKRYSNHPDFNMYKADIDKIIK